MSEFDQMYREVILDHYKNPRGHGTMDHADAEAEGQNPLCGDEVSIYVAFGDDGATTSEPCRRAPFRQTLLVTSIEVAPADEFPPGSVKLIVAGPGAYVGVYNCGGSLYAIEDRCSHDDGPLCEGTWDEDECTVVCPRHGSAFELATGLPRSLPAYEPVQTYPVRVVDGVVRVDVG